MNNYGKDLYKKQKKKESLKVFINKNQNNQMMNIKENKLEEQKNKIDNNIKNKKKNN